MIIIYNIKAVPADKMTCELNIMIFSCQNFKCVLIE